MEILIKIVEDNAFTTYLLPIINTFIGAVFGGLITIFVNHKHEKYRLRMEMKINLWKELNIEIKEISDSIIELEMINEGSSSDNDKVIEIVDICTKKIEPKLSIIEDILTNNVLIMEQVNYTDITKKKFESILYYSSEICKYTANTGINNFDKKKMKDFIYQFENEFIKLSGKLNYELSKDIMDKKTLNKKLKSLGI